VAKLSEQLKRMVKTSSVLREGIEEDEDQDLAEIDRGLELATEETTNEVIDKLLSGDKKCQQ